MRKTLAILLAATTLVTATAANAEWRDRRDYGHREYHGGGGGGGNWVAPLVGGMILGGIIGGMANQQPQYQQYPQPYDYGYQPVCNRYFAGRDAWGRPVFQMVCQ